MQLCKIGYTHAKGLHGCSHYCTLLARSMVRVHRSSRESLTKNSVYSVSYRMQVQGGRKDLYSIP